ncbi:hypothetical protein GGI11_001022 [Coemansia sp. RSA 2049]|nr:hypothetical protein H4217_001505 [Coemansia sp. RSA 1939]KAJ2524153.1 hypothetical protein GGI11_001022 [Coemansia sp. RSA 2049]KAJ2614434.1 hypothetical protein EV177_002061 [Coemansia sp. RSA 1804]KAJ2647985.1 hypothetical protein GGH99_007914 [Coemansia sp. RSA 1285]
MSTERWLDISLDAAKWEPVMELAYDMLALLDGNCVPEHNYKHIVLWNGDGSRIAKSDGGIYVQEIGFEQADIGGETWGSSVLLARRMARKAVDVSGHRRCIELGCGTGLVGFTVAHIFAESVDGCLNDTDKDGKTVIMTDYLPTIMKAVDAGAQKNGLLEMGIIKPMLLDWFEVAEQARLMKDREHVPIPQTHYLDGAQIENLAANNADDYASIDVARLDPVNSKGSFDLVVAADILYEIEHCLVIPRLVDFLLAPPSSYNACNRYSEPVPKFIVTVSLRKTHWAEVVAFEAEMAKIPDLVLASREDSSIRGDLVKWMKAPGNTHASNDGPTGRWADVQRAIEQDDDANGDQKQYRTYVFERRSSSDQLEKRHP